MSASTGIVMDDPSNLPGGLGGMIGIAGAAVVAGAVWLARNLPKLGVDRSADAAYRALIENQSAQIANQQVQVMNERARADRFMAALDEATTQISAMRSQIAALTEQVRILQGQITSIAPSHTP